jgi:mono/diheme cytochrome c family protein
MLSLFIHFALATPSDLPSGECANNPQTSAESTGKELYETHCASCHQNDGTGEAGFFPPLIGTPWVQDSTAFAHILFRGLSGTIEVNGGRYASYMSPYGKDLTDKDVYQIIHYVQHSLNAFPKDESFTVESVTAIRATASTQQTVRGQSGLDALLTPASTTE